MYDDAIWVSIFDALTPFANDQTHCENMATAVRRVVGRRAWTCLEIKQAKTMYEQGVPYDEIARKLHRSANAVKQRLHHAGVTRGALRPA